MKCSSCGRLNRENRRFCGGCGAQILIGCSRCGFGNFPDELYCGGCGVKLGSSSTAGAPASPEVQTKSRSGLSMDAIKELKAIKDKSVKPGVAEEKAVSQDDIDRMFRKDKPS